MGMAWPVRPTASHGPSGTVGLLWVTLETRPPPSVPRTSSSGNENTASYFILILFSFHGLIKSLKQPYNC